VAKTLVKPFVIQSLIRASGDGSQWDIDLAGIPPRRHKVLAKALREAADRIESGRSVGEEGAMSVTIPIKKAKKHGR